MSGPRRQFLVPRVNYQSKHPPSQAAIAFKFAQLKHKNKFKMPPMPGQIERPGIQRMERLREFSDLKIYIDTGKYHREFKVHKVVISEHMGYFKAADLLRNNILEIKDIDDYIFEIILDFAYCERPPITKNLLEAAKLYAAAHELKVYVLKEMVCHDICVKISEHTPEKVVMDVDSDDSEEMKQPTLKEDMEYIAKALIISLKAFNERDIGLYWRMWAQVRARHMFKGLSDLDTWRDYLAAHMDVGIELFAYFANNDGRLKD